GENRYVWMKSLGNKRILSKSGPQIQIAEPKAAIDLVRLADETREQGRRILFFCSCQVPRWRKNIACHRATVAQLLLKAANKSEAKIEVVEWPGGEPRLIDVDLNAKDYEVVSKARMTIPLPDSVPWPEFAG